MPGVAFGDFPLKSTPAPTNSESPHERSSFRCSYGGYLWTFSWHEISSGGIPKPARWFSFPCWCKNCLLLLYKISENMSSFTLQMTGELVLFEEAKGFESFVEKPYVQLIISPAGSFGTFWPDKRKPREDPETSATYLCRSLQNKSDDCHYNAYYTLNIYISIYMQ